MSNLRYTYWLTEIPDDCDSDPDRRIELAILEADGEDGLLDWVIPCEWRLIFDDGNRIAIVRISGHDKRMDRHSFFGSLGGKFGGWTNDEMDKAIAMYAVKEVIA